MSVAPPGPSPGGSWPPVAINEAYAKVPNSRVASTMARTFSGFALNGISHPGFMTKPVGPRSRMSSSDVRGDIVGGTGEQKRSRDIPEKGTVVAEYMFRDAPRTRRVLRAPLRPELGPRPASFARTATTFIRARPRRYDRYSQGNELVFPYLKNMVSRGQPRFNPYHASSYTRASLSNPSSPSS